VTTTQPPEAEALTPEEATQILHENFAPWILSLNLTVERTTPTHTTVRLPWSWPASKRLQRTA